MGQSLLMLPADVVGTYLERLPIFADYKETIPASRTSSSASRRTC
jgi:hypothetical protein